MEFTESKEVEATRIGDKIRKLNYSICNSYGSKIEKSPHPKNIGVLHNSDTKEIKRLLSKHRCRCFIGSLNIEENKLCIYGRKYVKDWSKILEHIGIEEKSLTIILSREEPKLEY